MLFMRCRYRNNLVKSFRYLPFGPKEIAVSWLGAAKIHMTKIISFTEGEEE